ncbi:MAG: M1 family aminopeptidase [Myxococcales bacterium]
MHSNGPDSTCAPHTPSRFVLAGTERQYERSRPFVLQHQALDVTLLVESSSIDARATLSFSRVDPSATVLILDAVGFELDAVRFLDDESVSDATYAYDGDELSITIPVEVTEGRIEIDYRAKPRRGLYFLAPDEAVPDRPRQVWSQCQDEDARHWFPCHDAPNMKLTSELTVTVPADWVALSNGTCIEEEIGADDGKVSIFHFRLDRPHPSYLVTLAAGHFSILEDRPASLESGRRIPIRYYVPEGRESEAWRSLSDTPRMVELFSRLTGLEYPFDSYTQVVVHDFIFGGMENTTATTLYEHVLLDERAAIDVDSRSLVAHELAHQWFGDTLTCRDWHEAWLNEGFATYFEHLEREDRLGRDDYDWSILRAFDGYMAEFNESYDRPIVCRDYMAPIDLFDRHLYEKGSLVLHMLRRKLGDDVFWSAIREYARSNADQIVETVQLQRTCEKVSGQSLDRFFDDWIYRSGHPELTVSASYEFGRLIVTLKQEPKGSRTEPFAVPFEIRIQTQDRGWVNLRRESTQLVESIVITLEQRPLAIAFDPDLRITAPIRLEFGFDWLKGVLQSDASVRSRMLAAAALRSRQDKPSLELLRDILTDSSQPYMLRVECARSLGKTRAQETVSHLVAAVDADRAEVRRAVAFALGQFRHTAVVAPLLGLAESDPSYLVVAEAYRALGRSCQPEAKQALLGALGSPSWADVVRSGAIDGLTELRDKELLPTIYDQTRYGTPSRGRRAAALALGRLGSDRETRLKLEVLLDDPDPHLRSDVVEALLELGQLEAQRALSARLEVEADTRVQRRLREALRDLGSRDASTAKRLSDDLVALKTKVAELETKVARLEPTLPQDDTAPPKQAAKVTPGKTSSSKASARSKAKAGSSRKRVKTTTTKPSKTRGKKKPQRGRS